MLPEKKQLSAARIEAQAAFELPDREMMALINVVALNGVNVAVPIGIAANVCGIDANVLAQQVNQSDSPVSCDAQTETRAFQNAAARAGAIL